MKKLLLASFIMFGCVGFAAAQATDPVDASKTTTPVKSKTTAPAKEIAAKNELQKAQGARVITTASATKPKRQVGKTVVATPPKKAN